MTPEAVQVTPGTIIQRSDGRQWMVRQRRHGRRGFIMWMDNHTHSTPWPVLARDFAAGAFVVSYGDQELQS